MYIFHNLTILCYIVIFNKIQCGELLFYSIVTKVSKFAAIWISDCFFGFVKIKFSIHTQRQKLLLSCIRMILGTTVPALQFLEVQASASAFDRH